MSESTTDIRIVPLPTGQDVLTEVLRNGARRMLAEAVEAEVAAWIDAHAHLKDDAGRRQVVRNGHLPERTIQTGIGEIEVQQPRVHDRRPAGQREAFTPAVLGNCQLLWTGESQAAGFCLTPSTKTVPLTTSGRSVEPFNARHFFDADSISL